jgi:hypothetical protein
MKISALKTLVVSILVSGIVALGFATPAQAAAMTVTASATGTIATSGTNAYPITVTLTPATAGADAAEIDLPTGWSFVNRPTVCASLTITSLQGSISCSAISGFLMLDRSGTAFVTNSNALITVEFPVGSLNVASNRVFTAGTSTMIPTPSPRDSGAATLASATPPSASPSASASSSSSASASSTASASASTDLANTGSSVGGVIAAGFGLVGLGVVALAVLQVVRYRRRNS